MGKGEKKAPVQVGFKLDDSSLTVVAGRGKGGIFKAGNREMENP